MNNIRKFLRKARQCVSSEEETRIFAEKGAQFKRINLRMLDMASAYSVVIALGLLALSMLMEVLRSLSLGFAILLALFLIFALFSRFYTRRHGEASNALCYLYMSIALGFAAGVGAFNTPDMPAVTFSIMLAAMPVLFLLPARPMKGYLAGAYLLYLALVFWRKEETLATLDAINGLVALCVGFTTRRIVADSRMRLFVANDMLESAGRQIVEANEQLARLSSTDALTGLNNRLHFNTVMEERFGEAEVIGLAMADLDDFKRLNDTYGHIAGDACLKEVGRILAEWASLRGYYVARTGGEEFVLVGFGEDKHAFARAIERVTKALHEANIPNMRSATGRVTFSVGVAEKREDGAETITDLVRMADGAMYWAKEHGKNQICLYDGGRK